jgi:hypothetical protein
MLYNAPNILIVKSAGNDRGDGPTAAVEHWVVINGSWQLSNTQRDRDGGVEGFGCINDPRGIAKNTLTIGAVEDIPSRYGNPSDVVITSFSNWGPLDDGRIKPDVVANGSGLLSSSNGSPTSYASLSGTSMSTPNVSGSVGLILEYQQEINPNVSLKSSTIKSLIIHNADEAGISPGPDYTFGWGLMNTYKVVRNMRLNHELGGEPLIKEIILDNNAQYNYQVESNGLQPLKVTIAWTDPAGTPAPPSLNPPNIMLVNDLDLRITGPGGTFTPWVLDKNNPASPPANGDNILDNVEQIYIENPVAGNYVVQVSHKGTLVNGSQLFSIVLSGIEMELPDQITLITPVNGSSNVILDPVFEWSHSTRSLDYQIQISEDDQFNSVILDSVVHGISFQSPVLPGLTDLFWRVRGINSGGEGPWSMTWSFNTTLAPPIVPNLIMPEDDANNIALDAEFIWNFTDLTDSYRLQVALNSSFTAIIFDDSTLTDTTIVVPGLTDGRRHYWRVNAKNSAGNGPYSDYRRFVTLLSPPTALSASLDSNLTVNLNWTDNSGTETKYFIMRQTGGQAFEIIDSLGANATTYNDLNVQLGNDYSYKIFCSNSFAVSDFSNEVLISIVSVENNRIQIPTKFELYSNFPNPFNPGTTIRFALPFDSNVKMVIYNALGEVVRELVNDPLSAGYYEFYFDSGNLSSGIYFYSIDANTVNNESYHFVRKMVLIK